MSYALKNQQKNILNFITGNFSKKYINEKNYIIYDYLNLQKKTINFEKLKKIELLVLKTQKINFLRIIYFLIRASFNINFKKNFILIYNHKKILTGNNIIPDWPGFYQRSNIFFNTYIWLKKTFKVIYFHQKIEMIILEIK